MMVPYGRLAHTAICAVSRLAEEYGRRRLSSADIAKSRNLPQPIVAKVLTGLSQVGLVSGATGPGGGYTLTKPPDQIRLYDVMRHFERMDSSPTCPFGPQWCGTGHSCPLHDQILDLRDHAARFLENNTFASFHAVATSPHADQPQEDAAALPDSGR